MNSIRSWLVLDEAEKSLPYQDEDGIWTVGIGHNMEANPIPLSVLAMIEPAAPESRGIYPSSLDFIRSHGGLDGDEIDTLFNHDLNIVNQWLLPKFPGVTGARLAALQNMGFNLGETRFADFDTFIPLVQAGRWNDAANDLAHTLVYRELPARYYRICKTLITGEWPPVLENF